METMDTAIFSYAPRFAAHLKVVSKNGLTQIFSPLLMTIFVLGGQHKREKCGLNCWKPHAETRPQGFPFRRLFTVGSHWCPNCSQVAKLSEN